MQQIEVSADSYPIISSGPDWLTATAKGGSAMWEFSAIADEVLEEERRAGGKVSRASLHGFEGWKAAGFFSGCRQHDSAIILSGPRTPPLFAKVAQEATNVSRLDLQTTIACEHDRPHLGKQGYHHLARSPNKRGRQGKLTLTQSLPRGETLNVNSRSSDAYGRLYDKATEAKIGEARSLWRYEVEFKRGRALHYTRALLARDDPPTESASLVFDWWDTKGLRPLYDRPSGTASIAELGHVQRNRNVLSWFEESLQVTVARAINQYGFEPTIKALGLESRFQTERERSNDGPSDCTRSVSSDSGG